MRTGRLRMNTLLAIVLLFTMFGFCDGPDDFIVLGQQSAFIRIVQSRLKRKTESPTHFPRGVFRQLGGPRAEARFKRGGEPFPFLTPRFYQASYLQLFSQQL